MKKLLIPGGLLLGLALTIVVACNKEQQDVSAPKKEEQVTADQSKTLSTTALEAAYTTNTTYGFLVFADTAKMNSYLNELVGTTHQEIRDQQSAEHFTSLGATYYSDVAGTDTITQEQAPLYFMNSDGVVQIQKVVFKQINQTAAQTSWNYFLTMKPASLNTSYYASLASGTYLSDIMNKFADGETLSGGLFEVIDDTPYGYEATGTGNTANRPFIGWADINGPVLVNCSGNPNCICEQHTRRHFIFWIWDGQQVVTETNPVCSY